MYLYAAAATPTISPATNTFTAFTTTYGTPSTAQTVAVTGSGLSVDITATAATGFEVANDGATYGSSTTFAQTSGSASGTLSIRLKADAAATGSYNSITAVTLTSTGATTRTYATAATGNSVATKALTITGLTGSNKVYDALTGASFTGTAAYAGLANGETFSVTGTPAATFASKTVGNAKPITVTGYTAPSTNYTVSQPTGLTGDITAAPLTVTGASGTNKEYDATNAASITGGSLSGVLLSDVVNLTSGAGTFAQSAIGTGIAVTPNFSISGTDAGNYSLTQPSGLTADITAKALTITGVTADNKVFDGNTTATLSGTPALVGVVASDIADVTLGGTYSANFASSAVGTGIAVTVTGYTISGSASGNYTLSQPTGLTANITSAATPVITSSLTATEVYGTPITTYTITGTNSPTSYNATGLPAGLSVNTSTGDITGTPTAAPGTYNVTITATNGGGDGTATLVFTINAKTLTIAGAAAGNKEYDRTTAATITGTLTGIFGADDVAFSGTGTFAQATIGTGIAVTSTATLTGSTAGNYTLTQPTGLTADITAKALTITGATADNKSYTGTTAATISGATLVGVISPDAVTVSGGGTFADANVGTAIAVTAALSLAGADAGNYTLTQPTGLSADITTAALTITGLTGTNKVYDGTTAASFTGTAAYAGLQNGETFSVSGTPAASFVDATAGTGKTINITGYTAPSTNYTLSAVSITADITPVALTITGISISNKVYDGTTTATITGTPAYVGLVSPESFSVTGTPAANFATANVGTGIAVTVTGYTAPTANYTVTQPTGFTADITIASQTINFTTFTSPITTATTTFSLTATATSGLTVSFASSNPAVATISGNTVTVVGAGTTIITASQAGDGNYTAAADQTQTLVVNQAPVPIVTFDFAGLGGSEPSANSNFNNANLSNSTITRGTLTASANADRFNATDWATGSIANAITGNDYMQFTVTPNAGYQFSVASVTFQIQRSGTGFTQIALRNSVDNYGSDLDAIKSVVDNTSTQTFTFTFNQSNSSQAVTYRLYGYAEGTGGSGGPGDGAGNDIVVNGIVSVAPPAVTSFAPTSGFAGSTVVITGTAFTSASAVSFGGTAAASFTVNSATQITATVATGTTGTVSVTTPAGTGNSAGTFTFNGYTTAQAGNWSTGATWLGGNEPPASSDINVAHALTQDVNYVIGNNNTLFIQSGGSLVIGETSNLSTLNGTGTINFNDQPVTIKSSAAGTGALGKIPGTLSGATVVTVERYIPANSFRAWRLLAIPITGAQTIRQSWQENQNPLVVGTAGLGTQITSNLGGNQPGAQGLGFDDYTPRPSMLKYLPATDELVSVTNTSSAIADEQGYFIYIRGDRSKGRANATTDFNATTLRTTGTVRHSAVTTTIPAGQFRLVGNPYPSAIDLTQVTISGGSVGTPLEIWDPKQGTTGGYKYLTFDGNDYTVSPGGDSYPSTGSVVNTIQSGQAFFVAATGTTGSILISESSKASGSTQVFRPSGTNAASERFFTTLYATNNGGNATMDGTFISFDDAFSDAIDQYDGKKMANFTENFSILKNAVQLAVEKRRPIVANDTVFFNMAAMRQISYRLDFAAENMDHPNMIAMLEDTYLNTYTVINLNGATSYDFTVDANAGSSASNRFRIVFRSAIVVPVNFVSIRASQSASNIAVEWKVSSQLNVNHYEVEKSTDGRNFTVIASVNAATGLTYNWLDQNVARGYNYYRVKSVDNNGQVKYTDVVKVNTGKAGAAITVSPNPVHGNFINIQFADQRPGKYNIRIINNAGQVVYNRVLQHAGGNSSQSFTLSSAVERGIYQLEVITPDNNRHVEKLIINPAN